MNEDTNNIEAEKPLYGDWMIAKRRGRRPTLRPNNNGKQALSREKLSNRFGALTEEVAEKGEEEMPRDQSGKAVPGGKGNNDLLRKTKQGHETAKDTIAEGTQKQTKSMGNQKEARQGTQNQGLDTGTKGGNGVKEGGGIETSLGGGGSGVFISRNKSVNQKLNGAGNLFPSGNK
ncbi:unnamed protein product [Linum trigynum]|uniref:Uncharacterized protein n=1 Tax=Linum trigynum TaxID=586398 RepID=A0AAV2GK49_9ROSI